MKKIITIIVTFFLCFLGVKIYYKERYENINIIKTQMKNYLKNKYGENFEIILPPVYSEDYYDGIIYLPKYEKDIFYYSNVYADIKEIPILNIKKIIRFSDTYLEIKVKESLEKGLKPKLKELFGKNVLVALQLEGVCKYGNYKEEIEYRKKKGKNKPLSGGIYIFGRVENEKDREKYRKGIYEFIQYLKQEGMFEYIDIEIRVLDERILSKGYNENYEDQATIESFGNYYEREKREKIYGKYTQDFLETPQEYKNKVLDNKIKSSMNKEKSLLYIRIQSPKIAKQLEEPIIDYEKISNVRFNLGMYDDDWKFKK